MKVILGSASPRRREMLSGLFNEIRVIPSSIDEKIIPGETPEEFTVRISREKALDIRNRGKIKSPALLITSDTVVAVDNRILGKPADHDDAVSMLSLLSRRWHRVISSINLEYIHGDSHSSLTGFEVTGVRFKELSRTAIEEYLEKIDYSDKAGSYAIQESGEMIIDDLEGSITNVIGFPLRKFFSMLAGMKMLEKLF